MPLVKPMPDDDGKDKVEELNHNPILPFAHDGGETAERGCGMGGSCVACFP